MAKGKKNNNGNGKQFTSQQSVNSAIKSICDIMRRSNCAGAMQYVPELTWILFLRILDETEIRETDEHEALGIEFKPSLSAPFRWQDWAAPFNKEITVSRNGHRQGWKRKELTDGPMGDYFKFANQELIPHLRGLKDKPNAAPRQKVISEIMSGIERARIDTERNFLDVIDKVQEISVHTVDPIHVFPLSQVYEGLLLKIGEKNNDGGQFFTPREIIRAMVRTINPVIGETVYDPGCGTGGFLAQSYEYMKDAPGADTTADQLETLKHRTFYGREKENLIYPIALANLILHGIDQPNIWHGNTLTNEKTYDGLFLDAPPQYDVVLMNPPFGGKEGKAAQTEFAYKTGATQVLFLQHVMDSLKPGGRCGIVLDEGVLFRTNETAFVQTKRKLLEEFFKLLPIRGDSERSWTIDFTARKQKALEEAGPFKTAAREKEQQAVRWKERLSELKKAEPSDRTAIMEAEQKFTELIKEAREQSAKAGEIEDAIYDLKAVNPHAKGEGDTRTPEELLDLIKIKGKEIAEALSP